MKVVLIKITSLTNGAYLPETLKILRYNMSRTFQAIEYGESYYKSYNCNIVFLVHRKDCVLVS